MRRVLFIAYHFPPLAGGGTFRSLKFVKYLPEFGWLPTVITTNTKNYWAYDETLLEEVPKGVKIIRAGELNPFYLQIVLSKFGLTSLYQLIKDKLFIPDEKIGWIPFAYLQAKRETKRDKYDLIFSTSPTPCAHLIAYRLKKETGLPWIADYRDLWTLNPEYHYVDSIRFKKEFQLERSSISLSDAIISVTKGNQSEVQKEFHIKKKKLSLIYNGFDISNTEKNNNRYSNSSAQFVITYTGTFYGSRNPDQFLKALFLIKLQNEDIFRSFQINFYGKSDYNIIRKARQLKMEKIINYVYFIPSTEITSVYATTDILLLIIPGNEKYILTSKIFDYLSTRKPILALTPDGEAKQILQKSGLGYFADPNDVEDIKNQILNLYNLWKLNQLHPKTNKEFINQFHRRKLTEKLAIIFNKVCKAKNL